MIFSIKQLTEREREICEKTMSSKAIFALVGDSIMKKQSLSIVRMGDGEKYILTAEDETIFTTLELKHPDWRKRMGIDGLPIDIIKQHILEAGNTSTYFAPSVSGISYPRYDLYDFFHPRPFYVDNFFVNDWTHEMIQSLLAASQGVFILHYDPEQIIQNFQKNYSPLPALSGFPKISWRDNDAGVQAAVKSDAQLILFSGGPAGKVIGPRIAEAANKIVLDVGNTMLTWSLKAK